VENDLLIRTVGDDGDENCEMAEEEKYNDDLRDILFARVWIIKR
jgi:hypothetical protein